MAKNHLPVPRLKPPLSSSGRSFTPEIFGSHWIGSMGSPVIFHGKMMGKLVENDHFCWEKKHFCWKRPWFDGIYGLPDLMELKKTQFLLGKRPFFSTGSPVFYFSGKLGKLPWKLRFRSSLKYPVIGESPEKCGPFADSCPLLIMIPGHYNLLRIIEYE